MTHTQSRGVGTVADDARGAAAKVVDLEGVRRTMRAVREGCTVMWQDEFGDIADVQVFPSAQAAADALEQLSMFALSGDRILWYAAATGEVFYRQPFPSRLAAETAYTQIVRAVVGRELTGTT